MQSAVGLGDFRSFVVSISVLPCCRICYEFEINWLERRYRASLLNSDAVTLCPFHPCCHELVLAWPEVFFHMCADDDRSFVNTTKPNPGKSG